MLFKEPKSTFNYKNEPFSSDYFSNAIYRFNNESIELSKEFIKTANVINESLLMEDVFLLSEGSRDYIDDIIKYLESSRKFINELWARFATEHSIARREVGQLVGRAINGLDANGYVYTGYVYTLGDENIHIDRMINQSETALRSYIIGGNFDKEKSMDDSYFDKLRGKLVGTQEVDAEDFQSYLFKHYRNNRTRPVSISVTPDVKEEMLSAIFDVDSSLENCVHMKNNIVTYIDSLISHFKRLGSIAKSNSDSALHSTGSKEMTKSALKANDVFELASLQIGIHRKLIRIYTLMLTAKLDAINERHRTYTKVIVRIMKEQEENRGGENE